MTIATRTLRLTVVALGFMVSAGQVEAGLILSPVAVLQNTGGINSSPYDIGNTINQSGLSTNFVSGVTDFDTYLAGNPLHNYLADNNEWFTPLNVTSSTIIYDLGAVYSIARLTLWNEEFSGIASMSVSTSVDPSFATSSSVGVFAPANNPFDQDYAAQVFDLTDTTARYVQLVVTGPQVPNQGNYVSMGEIAFETLAPTTAVPEPSTLISGGLAALVGLAWRHRQHKAATTFDS